MAYTFVMVACLRSCRAWILLEKGQGCISEVQALGVCITWYLTTYLFEFYIHNYLRCNCYVIMFGNWIVRRILNMNYWTKIDTLRSFRFMKSSIMELMRHKQDSPQRSMLSCFLITPWALLTTDVGYETLNLQCYHFFYLFILQLTYCCNPQHFLLTC